MAELETRIVKGLTIPGTQTNLTNDQVPNFGYVQSKIQEAAQSAGAAYTVHNGIYNNNGAAPINALNDNNKGLAKVYIALDDCSITYSDSTTKTFVKNKIYAIITTGATFADLRFGDAIGDFPMITLANTITNPNDGVELLDNTSYSYEGTGYVETNQNLLVDVVGDGTIDITPSSNSPIILKKAKANTDFRSIEFYSITPFNGSTPGLIKIGTSESSSLNGKYFDSTAQSGGVNKLQGLAEGLSKYYIDESDLNIAADEDIKIFVEIPTGATLGKLRVSGDFIKR